MFCSMSGTLFLNYFVRHEPFDIQFSPQHPAMPLTSVCELLQDCLVGLLFAFMPVLASNAASAKGEGTDDRPDIALLLLR